MQTDRASTVAAPRQCQLCGLTKKLVKSHVIPDNMNRLLRSVLGDNANAPILTIDKGTGKTKRYPMGLYESTSHANSSSSNSNEGARS